MEKQPNFEDKKSSISGDYIRHSKAGYETYKKVVSSDNPEKPFDPETQITPDLTAEGRELALREAEKYFEHLDPKKDNLFFASSNEARAIETADIYRQVAHTKGFEVVKQEHSRSSYAENISEGEIRVLETLSLNSENLVMDFIFNPKAGRKAINWEMVDEETKRKFDQAAAIVEADDQGNFGANFIKHSQKVKELLPETSSALDLYQTSFKNMLRLLRWAEKKSIQFGNQEKNIKILAFGHENALVYPIKELFDEEGLSNCEVVSFSSTGGDVKGVFREKERSL